MPLPLPNRCIWCKRQEPEISFDVSHVLPECIGNAHQHILPAGVVCKRCNNYFGSKVEPALLNDPMFHAIAVVLGLRDADDMERFREKIFDSTHQPDQPPKKEFVLRGKILGQERSISAEISYSLKGSLTRTFFLREVSFLSRAVHKIAFESLAWVLFVKGHEEEEKLDLFSPKFDPIRAWGREGQPLYKVRPVLRCPSNQLLSEWTTELVAFQNGMGMQINLFGEWYFVSLSSEHSDALTHMKEWVTSPRPDTWLISEDFFSFARLAAS
jgi:hypothetical protein